MYVKKSASFKQKMKIHGKSVWLDEHMKVCSLQHLQNNSQGGIAIRGPKTMRKIAAIAKKKKLRKIAVFGKGN